MATLAELAILLTAKDAASPILHKVQGEADKTGTAFSKIGGVAAAGLAVGVTAIAGLGAAAFQLGSEFDSAYDAIRTSTGATGAVLDGLKDDFKAVVSDVPADFGVAGEVMAGLNQRLGTTGVGLQDLSKQVLELSRITGTDAVGNVQLATRVFGDWSIASENQSGALDKVFRASQLTGAGIGDIMAKVVQFGAPLRAMNFSFEESVGLLGKWEQEGVNTELVLGSMRIAMGKFAKDNVPMREGLEKTIAEIQAMGPSAGATAKAMEIFGARAGPDMAAAILEGRFALGDLIKQIEEGGDTILSVGKETGDFAEKWKVMSNKIKVAFEPMAMRIFDLGGQLIDKLSPFVDAFAQVLPKAIDGTVAAFKYLRGAVLDESDLQALFALPEPIRAALTPIRHIGVAFKYLQGVMLDENDLQALFALPAPIRAALSPIRDLGKAVLSIGKQFVALGKFIGVAVSGGEDINGEFKKLSPVFQVVGSVIEKTIRNFQLLGRAGAEVIQAFTPIARMVGNVVGSLLGLAFGVRDTSTQIRAMAAPLELVAAGLTGFLALLATAKLIAFTGEMLGLAKSIVTFPLKPLIDAGKGVADFVTETGKLASKVITVTANVVTSGIEALANLFSGTPQTIKRNIETKDDRAFDEFFHKEQIVTRKVKTEVDEPDEAAAKSFASKITSLIGSAIGPAIGSAIGGALIAVAAGVSFVALLPAFLIGATVLAVAFAGFLLFKFKDEILLAVGAIAAVIVSAFKGLNSAYEALDRMVGDAISGVFRGVLSKVEEIWDGLPFALIGGLIGAAIVVSKWITDLQRDFSAGILKALTAASIWWRDLPKNIGLALADAIKEITGFIGEVFSIFDGFKPWDWVKEAVASFTAGFEGMIALIDRLRGKAAEPVVVATPTQASSTSDRGPSEETESGVGIPSPFVPSPSFSVSPISSGGNQGDEEVLGIRIAEPPLGEARLVTRQVFEAMQREAEGLELPVPTLAPIQPITVPAPILANFQAGLAEAHSFAGGAMAAIAGALSNIPDLPIPDASGFIALFAKSRRSVEAIVDQMSTNVAQTFEDTVNSGIEVFSELARFFSNDFVSGIRSGVSRTMEALGSLVTGFRDVFNQVISTIVNFIGQAMGAFGQFRPWDAVSGAFATLISNVGSSLGGFLDLIGNAVAEAGNLWDQLTQPQAPVFQPIPQPAPPFVPTPTPPPYEQPPDTGQDGFQTSPGQYKVVPGAPNQPTVIMAHGGEVIGRPFKNMMRGLKSYQTEEGEFKEIDGPLGASVPILAHGGEAIMPMSESRERVATVGFGDKQVVSPFDRAQQTIFEIIDSIVQASHTLGSALEEQAGQILGHLLQTRFGGFIDSVVGIVRSKDVLAGDENLFDPSKAIRSWDETFSEFMYRHDLGHIVGPDNRIFEDEFYRELTDLISLSSGKVSSYQSLDPITGQHESVSRELAAKLSASGSLFPTEVAARILGFTGSPESKGEETSKLGIREVFQNPQGEFWTRFGGSIEQPPPGFEFSYPEHFGVGIREAFQNALGDFWTRPLGNSEEPPHGFELAYPETFATAVREVFKNALDEFWTRPVGSEQEPPAGFEFAYPESFQTRPGEAKQVPGAPWQPKLAMVHGGEVVTRPINVSSGLSSSSGSSTGGITINGPLVNMGSVSVTNEADEQRLAQTIEQRLLDSLERLLGQGTPFPHALNMRT